MPLPAVSSSERLIPHQLSWCLPRKQSLRFDHPELPERRPRFLGALSHQHLTHASAHAGIPARIRTAGTRKALMKGPNELSASSDRPSAGKIGNIDRASDTASLSST